MLCSVCTCVNCAVCVRNCVGSAGDIGSWYFNSATSNCKKACESSVLVPVVGAGVVLCCVALEIGKTALIGYSSDTNVEGGIGNEVGHDGIRRLGDVDGCVVFRVGLRRITVAVGRTGGLGGHRHVAGPHAAV